MAIQELSFNDVQEVSGGSYVGRVWINDAPTNSPIAAYTSGVLSEAAAAQTILNSIDTSTLTGTTYVLPGVVGPMEMLAGGRMVSVYTIDPSSV